MHHSWVMKALREGELGLLHSKQVASDSFMA